jgi:hypothetical protein
LATTDIRIALLRACERQRLVLDEWVDERELKREGKKDLVRHAERNAVFYAGWLGHYVADAANPMHTTIHYDGWQGPNPNGYRTTKGIHWEFEGLFVLGAELTAGGRDLDAIEFLEQRFECHELVRRDAGRKHRVGGKR